MSNKKLFGLLLLTMSLLLWGSQAMATVWTDHYNASNGYFSAGEGISTITFDDWEYTGPGGRKAKDFAPINGFGTLGQQQHVMTLWPDRLTPDSPQNILHDMTNTPVYPNANMDAQVNFYYWGYTSPGFDVPTDFTAYRAADYSKSTRQGSLFNNMLIDLDGDYQVSKNDMHFNYYKVFSYVDATGVNSSQEVATTLSFQPYPVSDAIGWCGSVLASHPAALEVMAGQLTFDFAFDVYNGTNRIFMGTQIVPRFEMRSYGTLTVNVWAGGDLQTFTSNAVVNNTNPNNQDRWDVDPNYYSRVSFHGGGVLPDGVWVSADSFNPDGSRNLNPDGTWNLTVVPAGTAGAVWHSNAFAGYAFILRADGYRSLDWFNQSVYGPDPCTNKNCDDGNVCTTDSCVGGVCVHKPMSCPTGQACNPATGACAPFDFCAGVVCNDNNACTTDTCNSATGCVYTPVICNDNNACTTDSCNPATGCVYTPVVCNDNNACTTDTCSPATGCVFTPSVVCNDNNLCTTDTCDPVTGACVFAPKNCDDGNACTTDSCNPATGACVHTPINCSTVDTTNNNFTMNQPDGVAFGGTNDVHFTWDGTVRTSVAVSGQVSNATLTSPCKFFGNVWTAHDVTIYGPGTYTVYTGCPGGSPGCGLGDPIVFTVNSGERGAHMLFNWGVNKDIDVVDVWKQKAVYGPSPIWAGACGLNQSAKVWDWMSYDWDGDGVNGYAMVDGPFIGMNANFNVMGVPTVVDTTNNNFTMNQPDGVAFGGTNDVHFTWDGTVMTSVAESGQVSNATLTSPCKFFGNVWTAHDVAIYGPGTYTVYTGCPGGSPGCGLGDPIVFTVNAGEMGAHMLFNWGVNKDIDVVDVWQQKAVYGPSPIWAGACGLNQSAKVWDWMSYDWDGDGVNGYAMVDGPFIGMNANFNVMGTIDLCKSVVCNDNNACTTDACDPATGACVFTPVTCPAGQTCDPATGSCGAVNPCAGINCDDNNACTADTCNPATGVCSHTAISCDDNNVCTIDTCSPAIGCVHAPIVCNDNNNCTTDSCNPSSGCVYTPVTCPAGQTCDPATGTCGAVNLCAGKVCNDNNACTTDACDPATGLCVYTADIATCPSTTGNNFTMLDPGNNQAGGTNDVVFAWDGTMKTSVAVSGQISNALISSSCPFFGVPWAAHDVAIYGPGTYTIFSDCAAGSPGCGIGAPINFTVGAGQIGIHMLFDWNGNNNIDVVNVLNPNVSSTIWTGGCGSNSACTVWKWSSSDPDQDGVNGMPMVDGPFLGMNANFNLIKVSVDPCCNVNCDACSICDPIKGACVLAPVNKCDDNNACTTDSCDPATGCVHTPISCIASDACHAASCDNVLGCQQTPISCNDNNVCTTDSCDPAKGCTHSPISCDDNNNCTVDSCNPATGCVHTAVNADDNDICTIDSCDPVMGAVHTHIVPASCNDNNACTTDGCTANTCTHTAINCDDNDICTADSCNPATGCVHTATVPASCNDNNVCTIDGCANNACTHGAISCDDGNACTTDSCNPATGCVHAPNVCNDNDLCTTDSCDPATGACVFAPKCPTGTTCNPADGTCGPVCPAGSVMSVTILGGGQNPNFVDRQMMTSFSVVNNSGCIVAWAKNSVTATTGTILQYNVTVGAGPQPSTCTLNSAAVPCGINQITLTATGKVGTLILDNKANGGSDTDRITISAQ